MISLKLKFVTKKVMLISIQSREFTWMSNSENHSFKVYFSLPFVSFSLFDPYLA